MKEESLFTLTFPIMLPDEHTFFDNVLNGKDNYYVLKEPGLRIAGVSGTSAGAMNDSA